MLLALFIYREVLSLNNKNMSSPTLLPKIHFFKPISYFSLVTA